MNLQSLSVTPPWEWPSDARETVLEGLTNREAPVVDRILATELAGNLIVMSDALARALLSILEDPAEDPALRKTAASSLGPVLEDFEWFDDSDLDLDLGDRHCSEDTIEQIRAALRRTYHDAHVPAEVRRYALEASVRTREDWHADAVRTAYRSGDDGWRLTAAFCMRFVEGFEQEIAEALTDPELDVRFEALHAAGGWGVQAAWPHILDLLRDPEAADRALLLAAVEASSSMAAQTPDPRTELLSRLAASEDEELAEAAKDALMELEAGWSGDDAEVVEEW